MSKDDKQTRKVIEAWLHEDLRENLVVSYNKTDEEATIFVNRYMPRILTDIFTEIDEKVQNIIDKEKNHA